MSNMPDWISQRLKKISPDEFAHRVPKSKKNISFIQEHYSIPLASGCGKAILIAPQNNLPPDHFEPLIIFFHGLGQDGTSSFWHWIYEFVSRGVCVLSVDWDGHGAGGSSFLDLQEATRSIPILLQRLYGEENGSGLNEQRKGPRCFLMGYSFGASLALIAATRGDVFKHIFGVIAVSPVLSVQSFFRAFFEIFSLLSPFSLIYDFANKFSFYRLWGFMPSYSLLKKKKSPLKMKLNINYVEQTRNFVKETFENRQILKKVKTPVLWLHGKKDSVCPYYKACQLMLNIPSAFFSICDDERGHFRMIFSDHVTESSMNFIDNNFHYYKKDSQKSVP